MNRFRNFEEYIESCSEQSKEPLRKLRTIILEAAPKACETINYNIPAFTLVEGGKRDEQIMIAAYARHLGFYPHPATMAYFEPRLGKYKRNKGSLQFPLNEELPAKLIQEMVKYRLELLRK